MKDGLPLPQKIQNAPDLQTGLAIYFDAFMDLNTCRPMGLEPGPIPWLAINQYCDTLEVDKEQREDMHYFIREMDNAYYKFHKDKEPTIETQSKGI